jgi:ABC-type transport system involved in multi-copper enzyme maturation permease subunit
MSRWFAVGPHAFFDLVRLTRRRRSILVRIAYVLILLGMLAAADSSVGGSRNILRSNVNERASIAEEFCLTLLLAQNFAVLILLPLYVAASIHEERDRQTLPLLFTTHLSAREIVLGKLISRIGHVGMVVLAGLPVLSFVQLWGGVDMATIGLGFWHTGLLLFSVGGLSLAVATRLRGLLSAVMATYFVLFVLLCLCAIFRPFKSGYLFLLNFDDFRLNGLPWLLVDAAIMAGLHALLTLELVRRAGRTLEAQRGEAPVPIAIPIDDPTAPGALPAARPEVGDRPLLWKERFLERPFGFGFLFPLILVPFILVYLMAFFSVWIPERESGGGGLLASMTANLQTLMLGAFACYLFLTTFRLTGCIVREHQKHSLEPLLLLPLSPLEILADKLAGNLLRYWTWVVPFALPWLVLSLCIFGVGVGSMLLCALMAHLAFFTVLGLFLSVFCRTALSAYLTLGLVAVALLLGTLILSLLVDRAEGAVFFRDGANPVGCWIAICSHLYGFSSRWEVFWGVMAYAVGAIVLAALAWWRFRRRAREYG